MKRCLEPSVNDSIADEPASKKKRQTGTYSPTNNRQFGGVIDAVDRFNLGPNVWSQACIYFMRQIRNRCHPHQQNPFTPNDFDERSVYNTFMVYYLSFVDLIAMRFKGYQYHMAPWIAQWLLQYIVAETALSLHIL